MLALLKQARIGLIVERRDQQDFVRALEVMTAAPVVDQIYPAAELVGPSAICKAGGILENLHRMVGSLPV